jgi:hypothetical protein
MSNTSNSPRSGGVGIITVLLIVFVTLKLTGLIDWSWWWVLSPLWGPFVLIGTFLILYGIFAFLMAVYNEVQRQKSL